MARKFLRKNDGATSDMTPMIDVVFLLIIFFLCIDFRTLEAKLRTNLPKSLGSQQDPVPPVEQITLRIVNDAWGREVPRRARSETDSAERKTPFRLEGHVCHWELGPRRYDVLEDLERRLKAVAADPSQRVADPADAGRMKLVPVVIEPGVGATYADVALLVDVVTEAGFDEIRFGGGLARRR